MFERIKTYLLYGNIYYGIEHTVVNDETGIYVSKLSKKRDELNLELTKKEYSINSVAKIVSKGQHAFLAINDNQVLSKYINKPFAEPLRSVNEAFPHINVSEFYYEILPQEDNTLVSICRKTYVDKLIQEYNTKGIHVIDFSLGIQSISNVLQYIDNSEITLANQTVTIASNKISSIGLKDSLTGKHNFNINGQEVQSDYIISFSGVLQSVLKSGNTYSNFESTIHHIKYDFFQKIFFKQFLKFGLGFLLLLLLINFFVFNHYYNKLNKLIDTEQVNSNTKQTLVELNATVEKKQQTVENLLKSVNSKASFYLNGVVNLLPETILLSEFNYQPVSKRIKENEPIESDINTIILKGSALKGEGLSSYIKDVETLDWVESVEILDYGYESRNRSDFGLNILIKNE